MEEKNVKTSSEKLKELQTAMISLKKKIHDENENIRLAITNVGQKWSDEQFLDFKETYKDYQTGIAQFEEELNEVSKKTLPPLIDAAIEIEKIKM